MSEQPKGVTLDIWGTFLLGRPGFSRERMTVLSEVLGVTFDLDLATRLCRQVAKEADEESIRTGEDIPPFVRLQLFLKKYGISPDSLSMEAYLEWAKVLMCCRTHEHLPPFMEPDFLCTLRSLKANGLRVGVVSNTGLDGNETMEQVLRAHGVWDLLDAAVFSCSHGRAKPHPEIFRSAAALMCLPPESIIHVGDNPVADVKGAQRAGMIPCYLYGRPEVQQAPQDGVLCVKALSELPGIISNW